MSVPPSSCTVRPSRATPLAPDERRSMIVDAVAPLFREFGPAVTSRQLAEAAGVAEGTVYRAFGDKDALIQAVLDKRLDPAPLKQALKEIDPGLPLAEKVHIAVSLMRTRYREVFELMAMFGEYRKPPSKRSRDDLAQVFRDFLEPDLARLNCGPDRVAKLLQLLAFSSSLPHFSDGVSHSARELTEVILYGIAGIRPAPENRPEHATANNKP
ncbi:MAG: TetR/AcrR family transcriptional regulator [Microbacteriaceae bacterium]